MKILPSFAGRRHTTETRRRISETNLAVFAAKRAGRPKAGTSEYHRLWRATPAGRKSANDASRRYHSTPRGKKIQADRDRARTYGIRPEEYDAMILETGGYCPLCGRQTTKLPPFDLVVDHKHGNHGARGLICNACNQVIGYLEGHGLTIGWLGRVAEYLKI